MSEWQKHPYTGEYYRNTGKKVSYWRGGLRITGNSVWEKKGEDGTEYVIGDNLEMIEVDDTFMYDKPREGE